MVPLATVAPATPIHWSPCYQDIGSELGVAYECANVNVPLDYANEGGAAVQLALVRLPAAEPQQKMGSTLVNPGGPGGSGVNFVLDFGPFAGLVWGPEVRARFDIAGFDPRGIGRSTGASATPSGLHRALRPRLRAEIAFGPFR